METDGTDTSRRSAGAMLRAILGNVRVFGVTATIRALLARWLPIAPAAAEDRFDATYGVATEGHVGVADSDLEPGPREHAVAYQPTHERILAHVLSRLRRHAPGSTFIDIGSGKGRAVLLASLDPYATVVGIEASAAYCAEARENLERFRRTVGQRCADVEIIHADVRDVELPSSDLVLYLFNPFREPVLQALLRRIRQSCDECPRRVVLAYCNPSTDDEILRAHGLRKIEETHVLGRQWRWSLWRLDPS